MYVSPKAGRAGHVICPLMSSHECILLQIWDNSKQTVKLKLFTHFEDFKAYNLTYVKGGYIWESRLTKELGVSLLT